MKSPAPAPKIAQNTPSEKQQSKTEEVEQREAVKNQLYQNESDSSSSNESSSESEESNMQDILDKYEEDLNKSVISKQSKSIPGKQKIFKPTKEWVSSYPDLTWSSNP